MFNLYLDDIRSGPCGGECGWENWVVVRSVGVAKILLQFGLVNNMSLDHDLGQNSMTLDADLNPNGMDLVKWMVETNTWPEGWIEVHSANLPAAQNMRSLIEQYQPKEKV